MRTNLKADDVADLLEAPVVAILATRRADDTTMLSPVWFEWRDGGFNVWASASDKGKVGHIKRDPRVSIVVANCLSKPFKVDVLVVPRCRFSCGGKDRLGQLIALA